MSFYFQFLPTIQQFSFTDRQNNPHLRNSMHINLTNNAIQLLIQEVERDITVQVINLKKMKTTDRLNCELSDGIYKIRAYITDQKIKQSDNLAFINITSYGMLSQHERPMGIVVHTCSILDRYVEILGQPVDYLKDRNNPKLNKQNEIVIQKEKLKSQIDKNPHQLTHKKQQPINKRQQPLIQPKTILSNNTTKPTSIPVTSSGPLARVIDRGSVRIPRSQIQIENQSIKNYQKISDLYPDFPNWQIVARLVKKNYRQFTSKSGKGKLTKVLNVQFMDSLGMRITGALFGDSAQEYFDALRQNSIYQVSKGQIRQDQYNQNKGKNFSKYTIMFTKQSEFKLCENTSLVPNYQSNMKDLLYISQNRKIGQEYDAVGIVLEIHDEVEIPKDNKILYKQALEICDPVNDLIMEAVIWNRSIKLDRKIIGKTAGLFGFRLNQFNQKLSLNSSYTSQVRIMPDHAYKKYQNRKIQRERMEILSQKKDTARVEPEQTCKNLKELQNLLVYIEQGKQIRSTLTLILSLITYKKWSYQSCPYCRKSAQASNRCGNCDKYIEQTIPRYKLNVQLSDYCGSIWATGFEQLGCKLFADYPEGIKGIKNLQQNQRHRLFEKKQFQQFTVKLTSKLDRDGYVKHTVNRVYDYNLMSRIEENIKRIKDHL